jgi:hypothetical protein
MLNWSAIRNPVYDVEGWATKDACMARHGETIHLFLSAFFHDRGQERSHVAGVSTMDMIRFSDPALLWDGRGDGWTGMCSPNISAHQGAYVMTYNTWGDQHPNGRHNQLFYARSDDLIDWAAPRPLAPELTRGIRAIDAALERHSRRWFLVYKERQTPVMAWADELDGPWTRLGSVAGGWFENAQFICLGGIWHLVVTRRDHAPWLRRMKGDPDELASWLCWGEPISLLPPEEGFNTNERANAASLVDWREWDGYIYLLYAGRTEGESHAGRGDCRLALARSRDLNQWELPGSV